MFGVCVGESHRFGFCPSQGENCKNNLKGRSLKSFKNFGIRVYCVLDIYFDFSDYKIINLI